MEKIVIWPNTPYLRNDHENLNQNKLGKGKEEWSLSPTCSWITNLLKNYKTYVIRSPDMYNHSGGDHRTRKLRLNES
jgi:hypothetical protein